MSPELWIGVDIGGTKTAIVTSRRLPHVEQRREFPTRPDQGYQHSVERILFEIRSLLDTAGPHTLAGIGVSCGGPLDRVAGIIQAPPNLSTWHDVPIVAILHDAFGAPCRLENDANAGAVAEHRFGAGIGATNMIFITLGTGLGAGLILNGSLYHGATDAAGEIGHVRLSRTGPIGFGKAGSVEGWASGQGMAKVGIRMARAAAARSVHTPLAATLETHGTLTAQQVALAAAASDPVALSVVTHCGRRLGEGLSILIDVLNPEKIVLGGLAMRMGDMLLGPARRAISREALPCSVGACEILVAQTGEQIGDLAALCVADGSCANHDRTHG